MIEEQFVSFNTAKMLKEVGFNVSCRYSYDNVGGFRWLKIRELTPKEWIPCPTQALAARWLREKHRISLNVAFVQPSIDGDMWRYFVGKMDDMIWESEYKTSRKYVTYEQAMEAGLREAIKLINSKDYEKDFIQ